MDDEKRRKDFISRYSQLRIRVALEKNKKILFDWSRVAYLIPDIIFRHRELEREIEGHLIRKDEKFHAYVMTHVENYIEKEIMPPDAIAAPIINISEDILCGKEPVLKGGDYIALMNGMRKG